MIIRLDLLADALLQALMILWIVLATFIAGMALLVIAVSIYEAVLRYLFRQSIPWSGDVERKNR